MPDDGQQQGQQGDQGQQGSGDQAGQQAANAGTGQGTADDAAVLAQAYNPDAVKAALQRERDAAAAAKKEADEARAEAQKLKDAQLSDQERKDKEAKEATERATAAEAKALKYEVAAAKGVPLTQAHRLQGSTKEELETDADAFLEDVKGGNGTDFDGGASGRGGGNKGSFDDMIRSSASR